MFASVRRICAISLITEFRGQISHQKLNLLSHTFEHASLTNSLKSANASLQTLHLNLFSLESTGWCLDNAYG